MTLGMLEILRGGGFTTGGMIFDAKLRRQSTDRNDLFHAHIGGMDTMARSLLAAASRSSTTANSTPAAPTATPAGKSASDIFGGATLQELHDAQLASDKEPTRTSGHQEALENLVAKHIERPH